MPNEVMRTIFICEAGDTFAHEIFVPWLRSFSNLVGVIEIQDTRQRRWKRVRATWRRQGAWGLADAIAFRAYYAAFLASRDRRWCDRALALMPRRYALVEPVPILRVTDVNGAEVEAFVHEHRCDVMLIRCKSLLKRHVYGAARIGAFVVHPGICPEYRNAHGCFWALSRGDRSKVGATLLRIDDGIDTGDVFAYLYAKYNERNDSHRVIQERVVLRNLDAIAERLQAIARGEAHPIDTRDRPSRAWGQPGLTGYLKWKADARRRSKRAKQGGALLYHDVYTGDADASGFPGRGAGVYKMHAERFEAHLDALANAYPVGPKLVRSDSPSLARSAFMLTFDDGGVSSLAIADALERRGWRGHFFITAGAIAHRGFLSAQQIRDLHHRGHAIGTHSMTHPRIISALPRNEILQEWQESVALLSDILGESIRLASVPGGYSSPAVVACAAEAGIRFLWTSEPVRQVSTYGSLQVLGRYTLKENSPAALAVALADYRSSAHLMQWFKWNGLKLVKKASGPLYPMLRQQVLDRTEVPHGKA